MTNYVEVYFAAPGQRVVVQSIGDPLGLVFEPADEPDADYRSLRGDGSVDRVILDLAVEHGEDDLGVPFERMPYVLTVRGQSVDHEHEVASEDVIPALKRCGAKPVYGIYADSAVFDYWDPEHVGEYSDRAR